MKKVTVWLLAAIMIISLSACSSNSKKIIGTWSMEIDISDMLSEEFNSNQELDEFDTFNSTSDLKTKMMVEFREDGTHEIYLDEEQTNSAIDKWTNDFIDFMKEMLVKEAEALGMTYDELESVYKQENGGMSIEETLIQEFESGGIRDLEFEISSGKYMVTDDKLFTVEEDEDFNEDSYEIIEIKDDILTFKSTTDSDSDDENGFFSYPFELKKVK